MSGELIARIKRINRARAPEHSVALRIAVLGAVMTGALAISAEGAISPPVQVAVVIALPLSYWVSWRRRTKDNWHVKIALAFAALLALARFFGQLRGVVTLDEMRFPLADLFLWVQVLHGFDLPERKDLHFSLGSSVALMAIAGSISQDLRFAFFLVVYFVFAVAALLLAHRSEVRAGVTGSIGSRREGSRKDAASGWREGATASGAVILAGALVFLVLPQPTAPNVFGLPFSLGGGLGTLAGGRVLNPGFSMNPSARSSAASYYGFSSSLDLRVRGTLSDELVMRVRASAPAMWKALAFDRYDGVTWKGDRSQATPLQGDPPYDYPIPFRSLGPRAAITQTFYVEAEQPSAIFAAGQPDAVWFDGTVSIDELGALRTASTLSPGTVYSVVSTRGAAPPSALRRVSGAPAPAHVARYLQLPASLPGRVGALARRITKGATNDYDRVRAIEDHLRKNYLYDISSPVAPPGRDAVDHFLFDARVGFCEQFASATVVMLRSLGIPARVVAGYAVGRRNALTGYYEVKGSDAHSWVEVWFPRGLGWYEFDPTFDVPPAKVSLGEVFPLAKLLRFLADRATLPGGANSALSLLLVGGAAVTAAWAAVLVRRKARRRYRPPLAPPQQPRPGPVAQAFARLEQALVARRAGRSPAETGREMMARAADLRRPRSQRTLEAFEQERYGREPPPPAEVRAAVAELDRLALDAVADIGRRP